MRNYFPAIAIALIIGGDCCAQFAPRYEVKNMFHGKAAPLDLSSPDVRMYRTRLRYAIRQGPKFAGYYAVGVWGCGTGCTMWAIVDLRTGKATFLPGTVQWWFDNGDFKESEVRYKLNSRAWRVIGDMNEEDKPAERWFEWTGTEFTMISSVPIRRTAVKP